MKKRLWALALCLVMVSSLLPITAAADEIVLKEVIITTDEIMKDSSGYKMNISFFTIMSSGDQYVQNVTCNGGEIYTDRSCSSLLQTPPACGNTYFVKFLIQPTGQNTYNVNGLNPLCCVLLSPSSDSTLWINADSQGSGVVLVFELAYVSHNWQLTQTDSTLTAKCRNSGCPIQTVDVTLAADSVTLPESPFNARLEGLKQFQQEVPDAVIGNFVYKYKGPGDSEYSVVAPSAVNAKAGEYQVGVRIENLPGPVESDGPVAMAFGDNQDGTWYADLYVQYTAADPAITAQTGDNRPIEIMLVSALAFSALAAAAFILDSKRKYKQ